MAVALSLLLALPLAAAQEPPPQGADALAAAVAAACGRPHEASQVAFTFVVEVADEVKVQRRHTWRPRASDVTVDADSDPVTPPVTIAIQAAMPTSADDQRWAQLAPGVEPAAAFEAWSAFVNDQYWLLAPCKAADPGVVRSLDAQGRLVLTFEGVGLTPGDRYTFTFDGAHRVTAWDFVLQSGREGQYAWSPYTPKGPLQLSLQRTGTDGSVIRFDNVAVVP